MHKIAADEHDDVRLFEIGVGVRRRVEAERLLVRDDGRGHALPRVAVAVQHAHAELGECAEQSHFLGDDLAGAQERRPNAGRALLGSPSCDRRTCAVPCPSSTGCNLPAEFRNSGVTARSGESSTASASQPFGQAMPRFTG